MSGTSSETWKAFRKIWTKGSLPSGHQQSDLTVQPTWWHCHVWASESSAWSVEQTFNPIFLFCNFSTVTFSPLDPLSNMGLDSCSSPRSSSWLMVLPQLDHLITDVTSVYLCSALLLHSLLPLSFSRTENDLDWSFLVTSNQSTSQSLCSVGKPCSLFWDTGLQITVESWCHQWHSINCWICQSDIALKPFSLVSEILNKLLIIFTLVSSILFLLIEDTEYRGVLRYSQNTLSPASAHPCGNLFLSSRQLVWGTWKSQSQELNGRNWWIHPAKAYWWKRFLGAISEDKAL